MGIAYHATKMRKPLPPPEPPPPAALYDVRHPIRNDRYLEHLLDEYIETRESARAMEASNEARGDDKDSPSTNGPSE